MFLYKSILVNMDVLWCFMDTMLLQMCIFIIFTLACGQFLSGATGTPLQFDHIDLQNDCWCICAHGEIKTDSFTSILTVKIMNLRIIRIFVVDCPFLTTKLCKSVVLYHRL